MLFHPGDGPLTVTASPTEAAVDQPMTKSKIFSTNPVVQTPTDAKDASAAAASLRRYIIEHHSANQHTTTWDWLISSSVKAAIPEFSARFDQLYKLKQYVELNPQCGLRVNKCHIKAIMDPPGHDCDVHIGSGPPGSSYMAFDTNGTLLTSPMPFQKADNIILAQPVQYTEAGFEAILAILPKRIADTFSQQKDYLSTIELVLDVGRLPLIRVLVSKTGSVATSTDRNLPVSEVTMADINSICTHHSMGKFGSGNRAGIDRTLHRISRKLNGQNEVIGLTMVRYYCSIQYYVSMNNFLDVTASWTHAERIHESNF